MQELMEKDVLMEEVAATQAFDAPLGHTTILQTHTFCEN